MTYCNSFTYTNPINISLVDLNFIQDKSDTRAVVFCYLNTDLRFSCTIYEKRIRWGNKQQIIYKVTRLGENGIRTYSGCCEEYYATNWHCH